MAKVFVHVMPHYMAEESAPEKKRYVFSYTVSITNETLEPVQLMSRHWIITNGETLGTQEVRGDGVIGQQPIIKPVIATPIPQAPSWKPRWAPWLGTTPCLIMKVFSLMLRSQCLHWPSPTACINHENLCGR